MANDKQILSDALDGDINTVKEKIKTVADLSLYDEQGYSLFMLAVDSGNYELVGYLISVGANINESLDDGTMAIHMAASADHTDILELLIMNGAQLNALASPDLSTPLHFAAEASSIKAYNILIKRGADTNIKDKSGYLASEHIVHNE